MCYESENTKLNRRIEKELRKAKKLARRDLKVLLLGTGESGKSTFTKQMFIIHNSGFSPAMLALHRPYAFHNTIVFMQQLLTQMRRYETEFEKATNAQHAAVISSIQITYENAKILYGPGLCFEPKLIDAIQTLWADSGVQWVYGKRTEFELSDSAEYFFTNVQRLGDASYVPNNTDMLRIRLPTTGIQEHLFEMESDIQLRIMDVGGQRGERKIWINCFECVQSIIFLTALNEYDSFMVEDRRMLRRMSVSLDLFKVILQVRLLENASMILFLNKMDLFLEKLTHSPLSKTFPEYDGDDSDADAAAEFIKNLFLARSLESDELKAIDDAHSNVPTHQPVVMTRSAVFLNRRGSTNKAPPPRLIYTHFTTATDTENIQRVFDSIKHTIILNHCKEIIPGLRLH